MKRKTVIMLTFSIWFVSIVSCKRSQVFKTGLEGNPLPSFNLLLTDSVTKINTAGLQTIGKPIVLFFFSPSCPYCQAETEAIVKEITSLKDIQFCLLAYATISDIKAYETMYELKKFTNIIIGQDASASFCQYFKTNQVPYLALYDRTGKLKQVFLGNVEPRIIKMAIGV